MRSSGWFGPAAVMVWLGGGACGASGGVLVGTGGSGAPAGGRGGHSVVGMGGGGAGGATVCNVTTQPAVQLFPEIAIVLDTSASMNDPIDAACAAGCETKWSAAAAGINAAIAANPPDVGWGLSYIGGAANSCDRGGVGAIIGTGSVTGALANLTSGGMLTATANRPTRAAVDYAATFLTGQGDTAPLVILLITDGMPDCKPGEPDLHADDLTGTLTAISGAHVNGASTFVVGLAIADGATDAALNEMAMVGGLPRPISPAYSPASSSADVAAAMNGLVASTSCGFFVPPPPTNDGTASRSRIGVLVGGQQISQDVSDGWRYSDSAQTFIQLYGSSCETVRSGGTTVTIVYECLTV